MKHVSMGERALAMVAGALCLMGAIGYLLKDVIIDGAKFSLDHGQILITLFVTMFFLHLAYSAWSARVWGSVLSFGSLFVLGTALLVYASVGKQAEGYMLTAEQAVSDEAERVSIKPKLAKAEMMLASEQAELAAEVKNGGCGKTCQGIRVSVDTYESSVAGFKARLRELGVAKPVAAEAERFADIWATFGGNKEKAKAVLVMAYPFFRTGLLEFGSIAAFGFAFRPAGRRRNRVAAAVPEPKYPTVRDAPDSSDKVVRLHPVTRLTRKQDVVGDLLSRLANGERFGSQDELIELYDVPKATLSDWLGELEANGSVKRVMAGRKKRLAAA